PTPAQLELRRRLRLELRLQLRLTRTPTSAPKGIESQGRTGLSCGGQFSPSDRRLARRGDPAMEDMKTSDDVPQSASVSRRNFIKGVVAAGAVASPSAYLFRSTTWHGQPSAAG